MSAFICSPSKIKGKHSIEIEIVQASPMSRAEKTEMRSIYRLSTNITSSCPAKVLEGRKDHKSAWHQDIHKVYLHYIPYSFPTLTNLLVPIISQPLCSNYPY